jgi:hypothetical protein
MRAFPRSSQVAALTALTILAATGAPALAAGSKLRLEARAFRIIPSESGPVNYFQRVDSPSGDFIRATYKSPYKTAVLGVEIPDDFKHGLTNLSWRWRALALPTGANECAKGKSDSAAVGEKKRNPFRAQDTVVLESGEPLNTWKTVSIDPSAEFRAHFEDGNAAAEVPDLIGIGLMSDGDQTESVSSADYGDFVLTK